ncbi:type IX secretion system membrane protein PorP/SprF [Flavobacterium kingsejongi]|uniref:Type IX secretion system membrane protein PorP/SprF n=1 Tax=Flavobacterium kingsejongi TaxID=1678728 RepID=A0A2S1LL65_9FLAO|nr:type IX secretion system membrane protein PorP/SprF [Flavobacterium kingsejongi]AWG24266.1 hypothetical protein FK004_03010 [Flavobacterium kingsejongi]
MKTKLIFFVLMLVTVSSYAQQDAQYTQYMYNPININPAYAGSREALSIFGLHRTQWVGLDGAPVTNAASIHTPIENTNIGIGLSFVNDKIGPSDQNNISVDFSYTVPTSETFQLSFGLKATADLLNIDYTKLNIYNPSDPRFQNNVDNKFSPNIGAGIYFHSDQTYIGLSVPNFLETKHYDDNSTSVAQERLHYYFMAGHVFDLSYDVKFKPSLLTKVVQGAPLQVDLSANFLFFDKLTLGAAYRWSAAVSGMAGFQVSDAIFVGYAYDAESTKLANYNSGSHEIFLRFELFRNYDRMITPRFF